MERVVCNSPKMVHPVKGSITTGNMLQHLIFPRIAEHVSIPNTSFIYSVNFTRCFLSLSLSLSVTLLWLKSSFSSGQFHTRCHNCSVIITLQLLTMQSVSVPHRRTFNGKSMTNDAWLSRNELSRYSKSLKQRG